MGFFACTIVIGCLLFRAVRFDERNEPRLSKTSPKDTWTLSDSHCFATIQYRSDAGALAEVCRAPGEAEGKAQMLENSTKI